MSLQTSTRRATSDSLTLGCSRLVPVRIPSGVYYPNGVVVALSALPTCCASVCLRPAFFHNGIVKVVTQMTCLNFDRNLFTCQESSNYFQCIMCHDEIFVFELVNAQCSA